MNNIVFPKRTVNRQLQKRADGLLGVGQGFRMENDGVEEITYSVSVSMSDLDSMARRAAASKGQVCRDGALIVNVISRRRIG